MEPYRVGLVTFPVALLSRSDILRHVVEWGSPDFHTARGVTFALWIVVFTVIVAQGRRRVSRRDLLVALPLLLLGLWALRNVAVAPLVGLPIAALAAALVLVTAVFTVRAAEQPSFAYDGDPVAAMGTVRRDGLLGRRLLTTHVDAGYVILQSWPRQRVFIDDRYDMYPRPVIDDDLILTRARPGWAAVLARGTSR